MPKMKKMPVRLAFREEGPMWNCYMAQMGTMEGSYIIGSIAMGAVRKNPAIKQAFMDLMKQVLSLAVVDLTGAEPEKWFEQDAPPHEKAGRS